MIGVAAVTFGFLLMLALMTLGVHVAIAIFLVSAIACIVYLPFSALAAFGTTTWGTLNDFILTAIPLYILFGEILLRAGLAERMYASLSDWFNHLPGRLLHTNVASSAMFAAISGSSLATAATIGTVAIPALQSRAYNERLSLGSIAAGSTLGILIPPSIGMIIYGAITNTSIGHLFIAGILPGILLAVLFSLVIAIACLVRPRWAGTEGPHSSRAERLKRLRGLVAPMAIIALIVGAIYFGWATPTESAGIGVVAALLFAGATGKLSFEMLHDAFRSTVALTGMILLLIVAAFFLNFVISLLGVPQAITEFVVGLGTTPTQTLLVLVLFYLVLGCFLETMSMMIATVPIVVPVMVSLGFDPVWFGIVLVVLMEMTLITPPIGLNLYIVQRVRGRGSINDTTVGTLPFLIVMLATILLLIRFPGIALWLPGTMGN